MRVREAKVYRPVNKAQRIAGNLLEADAPVDAKSFIMGTKPMGKFQFYDTVITSVKSRDGKHLGRPTGSSCPCACGRGLRFRVCWDDGKITWICTNSVAIVDGTATLL